MINNINDIIGMLNSEDASTLIGIKEILTDIEGSEVILFTKNSNYQIKLIDDEQITLSLLLNSIRLSARQVKGDYNEEAEKAIDELNNVNLYNLGAKGFVKLYLDLIKKFENNKGVVQYISLKFLASSLYDLTISMYNQDQQSTMIGSAHYYILLGIFYATLASMIQPQNKEASEMFKSITNKLELLKQGKDLVITPQDGFIITPYIVAMRFREKAIEAGEFERYSMEDLIKKIREKL
ncbi:MAG: hypothetical protein KatS3mg002_1594 [Candidatus Woesearchaeota archaeon]|nr:MAG: hypothetical protein KatS3mg002_1594 [Candidatus Woesearchaeota archaeon]